MSVDKQELKDYYDCYGCLSNLFEEVDGYSFYQYVFPKNQSTGDHEVTADGFQPNAIYLYQPDDIIGETGIRKLKRRIMLDDTWEEDYARFIERNEFALCSGIAYRGRANTLNNAQQLHALIFDLDGVGIHELLTLLHRFDMDPDLIRTLPRPTFLVLSGTGVHLYYVLQDPIDLYPNIKYQLKQFKYEMTFRIWEYKETSKLQNIQQQSINQNFRMVGSTNSKHGNVVVAFKTGDRVTLDYLNKYSNEAKVDITKRYNSTMTREQAKQKYPEWYQKVIVNGIKSKGRWTVSQNVYEWWKRQADKVKGGHRYFYLLCLGIYAVKCCVSKEKLKEDMLQIYEKLKQVGHENPLTLEDVQSAMKIYQKELFNFTIDDIEKLTDIRIERNKRNGRKQVDHLKMARYIRDEINGKKDTWRKNNGRKDKFLEVLKFILKQKKKEFYMLPPEECRLSKNLCIKETQISKMTVYKHYDTALKLVIDDFDRLRMTDIDEFGSIPKKQLQYIKEYVERRYSHLPDSEEKKQTIKFDYYHEALKILYY